MTSRLKPSEPARPEARHDDGATAGSAVSAEEGAYRHILECIRTGVLGPGARVRSEDLASRVQMSRQPVREAIRRLAAEGYLTVRPRRGAVVSVYTPQQLLELFEIRAALEGLSMRLVAGTLTPLHLRRVEAALGDIARAGTDTNRWMASHNDFHLLLASLSGRPRLEREIARMHASLEPYLRLWFLQSGPPAHAHDDHSRLLQALRSGYAAHAEEVMRDHVLETAPAVIAHLKATGRIDSSTSSQDDPN